MWLPNRFTCCGSYFNCWIIDVKFPSYHNIHTCSFSPFLHYYKIYSGWKKNWYSTHWSQQSLSLAALQTPPPSIGVAVALSIYHHYLEHEDKGCSELCGDRGWPEHFIYQPVSQMTRHVAATDAFIVLTANAWIHELYAYTNTPLPSSLLTAPSYCAYTRTKLILCIATLIVWGKMQTWWVMKKSNCDWQEKLRTLVIYDNQQGVTCEWDPLNPVAQERGC